MHKTLDFKKTQFKLLGIAILFGIFFFSVYSIFSTTLTNYLYDQIENEALIVSRRNGSSLALLNTSIYEIENLMVKQLTNVAETLVTSSSADNRERNELLSQSLIVDEINWTDSNGEILYSTHGFEGYVFDDDHLIWNLLNGDLDYFVEDRRDNTHREGEYIFIYMSAGDSTVVQVGILTTTITELTKEFSVDSMISENLKNDRVISSFIYTNNEIYYGLEDSNYNSNHLGEEQWELLTSNENIRRQTTIDGEHALEFITTISDYTGTPIGSFYLAYSLTDTDTFVSRVCFFAFMFLVLISFLVILFMYMLFKREQVIKNASLLDLETNLLNAEYIRENYDYLCENNATKDTTISLFLISNFNRVHLLSSHGEFMKQLNQFIKVMSKYSESNEIYRYSEDVFIVISHHWNESQVVDSIKNIMDNHSSQFKLKSAIIKDAAGFDSVDTLFESYKVTVMQLRDSNSNDLVMNDDIHEKLLKRQTIERDMQILSTEGFGNQMHVEFQPQVDTQSGEVVGFETLTRWIHPVYGFISPPLIFNIAENSDYYNSLTRWILTQALEFIQKLNELGYTQPIVSVNAPHAYIMVPDCIHNVQNLLDLYDVSAKQLGFEITESPFDDLTKKINIRINELNALGITTYMDDYGRGYSSMLRLRDLDVNVLKIDKTFIDDINKDERFLNSIIDMAKDLNLEIIAEGAEEDYQVEWLKEKNCSVIQGYYFSKSLRFEDALNYIKNFKHSNLTNDTL